MEKYDKIIENWFNRVGEDINTDTREYYLLELFEELKEEGFTTSQSEEVGRTILGYIDQDFIDEGINMTFQVILANEINMAMRSVMRNVQEVVEEDFKSEGVVDDGDVYHQEGELDASELDIKGVEFDEEFDKMLGIK